ncbi:hypothetical protein HK405_003108 [Cladochytrium tenue]|nr:hypothetical protein HK405_003108 [Cladochytrium tenue]
MVVIIKVQTNGRYRLCYPFEASARHRYSYELDRRRRMFRTVGCNFINNVDIDSDTREESNSDESEFDQSSEDDDPWLFQATSSRSTDEEQEFGPESSESAPSSDAGNRVPRSNGSPMFDFQDFLSCCVLRDFERVRFMAAKDRGLVEITDQDGKNAVMFAAMEGHTDIVEILYILGGDINKSDNLGRTVLMWAALWARDDTVEYLLDNGVNWEAEDNDVVVSYHAARRSRTIARLDRGPMFRIVSAESGWESVPTEERKLLKSKRWHERVKQLCQIVGHEPDAHEYDKRDKGSYYRGHAEKKLVAFYVDRHVIIGEEAMRRVREPGTWTRSNKRLRKLSQYQPELPTAGRFIHVNRKVCEDCKVFFKRVKETLHLTFEIREDPVGRDQEPCPPATSSSVKALDENPQTASRTQLWPQRSPATHPTQKGKEPANMGAGIPGRKLRAETGDPMQPISEILEPKKTLESPIDIWNVAHFFEDTSEKGAEDDDEVDNEVGSDSASKGKGSPKACKVGCESTDGLTGMGEATNWGEVQDSFEVKDTSVVEMHGLDG